MTAVIKRTKIYPSGGSYRFAWKYYYDVEGLPVTLAGFDRLDSAISRAKEHGALKIVKAWAV